VSWVGGDIAGLQAMGSAMSQATNKTNDIVKTLNSRVDTLADDAEWRGAAAEAFRRVWSENSIQIGVLNASVTRAGNTIKTLGDELQLRENALHDAADKYSAKGVPIGPNGEPQAVVLKGDASESPAKDVLQAANEYKELYDSNMMLARKARTDAANNLSDCLDHLLPPENAKPNGLKPDERVTLEDYARGLLTVNNDKLRNLDDLRAKLSDARTRFKATRKPLQDAKAEYAAKGLKLPATNDAHLAHSDALKELNAAADRLGNAGVPKSVLPGSEWLNIKVADLAKSGSLVKTLPEQLAFLKEVPVLDVLATGAIGVLQGQDDHDKGRSTAASYISEGVAGAGGLVAGGLATAYVANAEVTVPATLAVAGVGAVVIGVGNIGNAAVNEHWMEDIHNDGIVAGVAEGIGHSVSNGITQTGTQVEDVGNWVWGGAKSAWNDAFG
jgi:uncharacterized protein YukE